MIIGLSGYAQTGKDTVAKILIEEHGYRRVAFADSIRQFLYEVDPPLGGPSLRTIVDDYGWDVAKANPAVRQLLQNVGLAARNQFGEDFWVKQALSTVDLFDNVVITDVRFKNEAQQIWDMYGSLWRVDRDGVSAVNNHISEHDLVDWKFDAYIENNGTVDDLNDRVTQLLLHHVNRTLS